MVDFERIGERLQLAREARGLSLEDVAADLCLTAAVVWDIEKGTCHNAVQSVYVKGFIRSYIHLLELDPVDVLGTETKTQPKPKPKPNEVSGPSCRVRPVQSGYESNIPKAGMLMGAVFAILAGFWILTGEDDSGYKTVSAAVPERLAGYIRGDVSEVEAGSLEIVSRKQVDITVTDSQGLERDYSLEPGRLVRLFVEGPVMVEATDMDAVSILYQGKPVVADMSGSNPVRVSEKPQPLRQATAR